MARVCLIVLAFLLLAVSTRPRAIAARSPAKGISMKLIHRDSVHPRMISIKPFIRALKDSRARLALLSLKSKARLDSAGFSPDDIRGGVLAESGATQFMVNFSIGQPPIPQLASMDTGSNLLWVQCLPCIRCFEQSSPIFDPSKSTTYKNLPCSSPLCVYPPKTGKCDPSNNCKYTLTYLDSTTTSGLIGYETLTFETSDEGLITVPDTPFGCGNDNDGYNGQPSGIMGLGPDSISLPVKLGSKFSYCFGSIRDPNYQQGRLVLGDGAIFEGDTSPLEVYNKLYYLSMESISIGEKKLAIDPSVFQRQPGGTGGVVIDSGTTLTMLTQEAFDVLSTEVQNLLEGKLIPVKDPHAPSHLCYKGNIGTDLQGFPVVTLEFAGGAELSLDTWAMFEENGPGEFCMAISNSELGGLSVIGVMAQQNYNIGFDVGGKKIYFQDIECGLLDSVPIN